MAWGEGGGEVRLVGARVAGCGCCLMVVFWFVCVVCVMAVVTGEVCCVVRVVVK